MKKLINITEIAQRLLSPNETLDLRLFDFSGKMHDDVRKQLLQNSDFVIRRTVGKIKGLELTDIFLNGSAASYFYYEKSDIDIRIEVQNKNCPYIVDDPKLLNRFLATVQTGSLNNFNFTLHKRFIDIKIKAEDSEPMGLYSILTNKWVIEPNRRVTEDLNLDDIMMGFKKRYYETQDYLQQLQNSGKLNTQDGIDELINYYTDIFSHNTSSTREYIIYKLLCYRGVLKDIKKLISDSYFNYLSLK